MRLIDADALMNHFANLAYDDWNQGAGTTWANAFAECAQMVEDFPTVEGEVEEVAFVDDCGDYLCTGCDAAIKSEIRFMVDKPIEYCPCCGRKVISFATD